MSFAYAPLIRVDNVPPPMKAQTDKQIQRVRILTNEIYNGVLVTTNFLFAIINLYVGWQIDLRSKLSMEIFIVAVTINAVFFLDMVANFYVFGPKTVWKSRKFIYLELFLQIGFVTLLTVQSIYGSF